MLNHTIDETTGIVTVQPTGPLSEGDFTALTTEVDAYLQDHEQLSGLLIDATEFAGWENFEGMVGHMKFIRDHHREIARIAFLSDNELVSHLPSLADHFVAAKVKSFRSADLDQARTWLSTPSTES